MWRILIGFLLVSGARADDRTPTEWAEELNTAYLNNGGYVATYGSETEKGTLAVTLGFHPISGVSAAFMDMNAIETQKVWFWTLGDDAVFIHNDNGEMAATMVMRGLKSAIQTMARIDAASRTDPQDRKPASSVITMRAALESDKFFVGPGANSHLKSPWKDDISNGVIVDSDADSMTVRSKERGDLTFGRKHGLLLFQSRPNSKGEARIFKLRDLRLSPDRESVEKIFAGLDDKVQAEVSVGSIAAASIYDWLQGIIGNTERGFADLNLLQTACEKEADQLRAFAHQCVGKSGGTWPTAEEWKKALASCKDDLRKEWIKTLPKGVQPDEKDFEIYLARADVREEFSKTFAEGLEAKKGATALAMNNLFEKQLVAETESGKAAKRILESAFTKAYLEAITDQKLKTFWSQREGFD